MDTTLFYGIVIVLAVSPLLLSSFHSIRQQKLLRKQMEQRQEYLASLTSGDEVLLLSGIHGKIISIKDDLVSLQIAKGVVIYVGKESVMGKTKELLFK
ncbi:preprotein translocase subunit YajC [Streptococcus pneumoniae]|uniref:preprotein translocase subunit YajC n=1 Tax=Streptococcus pneumoniae TaxID=1313 RepID=UPI0005E485EA|nr:preprotein translocase subunit YajC [Streptococcus pneumoniae]MDG7178011.1 preprotein translocase subunit YajC [Streptococcus pneumoniae]MDG8298513.1 preprotein translocase subunit YajC [Streptococcus pneumoniae]MDG8745340.1 preprotein translocase subunit YajC [Streptococcus pneumoniae]MDG9056929.1 preprotein translocase subunit YajC [Streptococcus pneumoniae]MDH7728350.1 preprotein translocase subunit YajC [Streptococcus pneumoniae]